MKRIVLLALVMASPAWASREAKPYGSHKHRKEGISDLNKCGRDCPTGTHAADFHHDAKCGGEEGENNAVKCVGDTGEQFTACGSGCPFDYYEDHDAPNTSPKCGDRPKEAGPAVTCKQL
jgi:hypothetical protein